MTGNVASGRQWVVALEKWVFLIMESPTTNVIGEKKGRGEEGMRRWWLWVLMTGDEVADCRPGVWASVMAWQWHQACKKDPLLIRARKTPRASNHSLLQNPMTEEEVAVGDEGHWFGLTEKWWATRFTVLYTTVQWYKPLFISHIWLMFNSIRR